MCAPAHIATHLLRTRGVIGGDERLAGVRPHVGVRVLEGRGQRADGGAVAGPPAEREDGGLAHVEVRIRQGVRQRGHREFGVRSGECPCGSLPDLPGRLP